ncbi:MAG: radical SAM family heme chaperone HemW [Acutalibacteraceae bacterium]|nr:radical SAM family heme chaperone HemW [Acutalibacteraceae bacterium]
MAKPIGVYIHIPFCVKRCAYCDFYTAIMHGGTVADYVKKLKEEIYRWGETLCRPADTVYFGGGTPSALSAEVLAELLFCVKEAFYVYNDAEITVEVNPENVDKHYLKKLKNAGFNRLSIGVQSLDDGALKMLGRGHNSEKAVDVFKSARQVGFDNISVDLMCALPLCNSADCTESAKKILSLCPEHISCYMLILEEKTALYANKDKYSFPSEESVAKEYLELARLFSQNGYEHYEISNFTKAGKESCHNKKYWLGAEYIGIGPSAYSFVDGKRFHYENDLRGFIKNPITADDGTGGDFEEYIMLSLRLKEGLTENNIKEKYNKKFSQKFYLKARQYEKEGLAIFKDGRFFLTREGMLLSNTLICEMSEDELYEDL